MKRLKDKQLEHLILYEALTNEHPDYEMTLELDDLITKERLEFGHSFSMYAMTFHSLEVWHMYLAILTPLEKLFLGIRDR